jgi:dTDP-4-dehydrorhamnose 3,5-epimerase
VKAIATAIPDVVVVASPVFADARGFFTEVFHAEKFASLGLPTEFVQDNHSRSVRHVLRGLHFQVVEPQGKLVRAVTGRIFDVAVDLRRSSPTFGQWTGAVLEEGDGRQMWIPAGFAHGFLVLSEVADVSYKCTTPYRPSGDRSIRWNDPSIGIAWPLPPGVSPVLADRDAQAPPFLEAESIP